MLLIGIIGDPRMFEQLLRFWTIIRVSVRMYDVSKIIESMNKRQTHTQREATKCIQTWSDIATQNLGPTVKYSLGSLEYFQYFLLVESS